jgi:DNA-binding FrmR family transcriptional regulator
MKLAICAQMFDNIIGHMPKLYFYLPLGGKHMEDEAVQQQILRMLHEVKTSVDQMEVLANGTDCKEVLLRLSCIKSAIEQIGIYILESCAVECIRQDKRLVLETIDDMANVMISLKKINNLVDGPSISRSR